LVVEEERANAEREICAVAIAEDVLLISIEVVVVV
jgi:hypothetical protein